MIVKNSWETKKLKLPLIKGDPWSSSPGFETAAWKGFWKFSPNRPQSTFRTRAATEFFPATHSGGSRAGMAFRSNYSWNSMPTWIPDDSGSACESCSPNPRKHSEYPSTASREFPKVGWGEPLETALGATTEIQETAPGNIPYPTTSWDRGKMSGLSPGATGYPRIKSSA